MRDRDPWPRFMTPVHCSLFDFLFVFMGAYGWLARGSINARDGQDTEMERERERERWYALVSVVMATTKERERKTETVKERVSLRTQTISILPLIPEPSHSNGKWP